MNDTAEYRIDGAETCLEIKYMRQDPEEMAKFEASYYTEQAQTFYTAFKAHTFTSEAFQCPPHTQEAGVQLTNNYGLNNRFPNHGFIYFLPRADLLGNPGFDVEPFAMIAHNIVKIRVLLDTERMHPDGDLRFDDRDRHQMHYLWKLQCDSVEKEGSDKRKHPQNMEANEISNQMQYLYYDNTPNGEQGMQFVTDKVDRRVDLQFWGDHTNRVLGVVPFIQAVITWFNCRQLQLESSLQNAWAKPIEVPDHTVTQRHLNTLRTGKV